VKRLLIAIALFSLTVNFSFAQQVINLPKPKSSGKVSIEETIKMRRSVRSYYDKGLTDQQISQLLWAAQGITDDSFNFRAAPSAGAIFPLTIYVVRKDGVFKYNPLGHKLTEHLSGDLRPSMLRASLGQTCIKEAPVSFVITANGYKMREKYGGRSYRYICMEVGHAAENLQLQAISLGLSSVPIGSFWDDVIAKTLNIPPDEEPLYIIPVGYQSS